MLHCSTALVKFDKDLFADPKRESSANYAMLSPFEIFFRVSSALIDVPRYTNVLRHKLPTFSDRPLTSRESRACVGGRGRDVASCAPLVAPKLTLESRPIEPLLSRRNTGPIGL